MIGHQNISMYNAMLTQSDFAQLIKVANTIDVGEKAGLSVVAALDNMLRYTGKIDSWLAGHEALSPIMGDVLRMEFAISDVCR